MTISYSYQVDEYLVWQKELVWCNACALLFSNRLLIILAFNFCDTTHFYHDDDDDDDDWKQL